MEVQGILGLNALAGNVTLEAGASGLHRKIKRVTVMEAPDLPELLSGGELVLTTLYQLRNDIAAQQKLVERLNEKGAAALVIKTGRFVSGIAPEVKSVSDELGLPLVTIGKNVVFRDLIYEVVQNLVEEEIEDRDNRIVDAVVRSQDVAQVCAVVEESWNTPCLLLGPRGHLIEASSDNARSAYASAAADIREFLLHSSTPEALQGGPLIFEAAGLTLVPCRPGGKLLGYLALFTREKGRFALANQVASVLALRLLQDTSTIEVENSTRLRVVEQILSGHPLDTGLKQTLKGMGFLEGRSYVAVICRFACLWKEIPYAVDQYVSRLKADWPGCLSALRGSEAIAFFGLPEEPWGALPRLRRKIAPAYRVASGDPYFEGMAAGSIEPSIADLRRSYENAYSALTHVSAESARGACRFYDDMPLEVTIGRLRDTPDFKSLTSRFLAPLIEYDAEYGSELVETLRAFISCGGLQQAARRLNVHPNTVRYRLRKVSDLVGIDPETPRGLAYFFVLTQTI